MAIRWSGTSGVLHQGVIVLEWVGPMPETVLREFAIDHEIFDYVVYQQTGQSSQEKGESVQMTGNCITT